jgi:hypothetical protein
LTLRERSPSVWIITPQLIEQKGQVERVSVVRAIFSSRAWANAGPTSNPRTDTSVLAVVVSLRNCRRVVCMAFPARGRILALHDTNVVSHAMTIHLSPDRRRLLFCEQTGETSVAATLDRRRGNL